jgi:hypothetical protein
MNLQRGHSTFFVYVFPPPILFIIEALNVSHIFILHDGSKILLGRKNF